VSGFGNTLGGRRGRHFGTGIIQLDPEKATIGSGSGPGGTPRGSNVNAYLDELEKRLVGEGAQQQAAADRQFDRKQGVIDQMQELAGAAPGEVEAVARAGTDRLGELSQMLGGRADKFLEESNARLDALGGTVNRDLDQVMRGANRIEKGVDKAVGAAVSRANQYASDAVGSSKAAADNYQQDQSALIQATVAGIDKRAKEAVRMAQSGLRPDGTRMSPAEQQSMMREMQVSIAAESASVAAQIQSEANNTMASLRNTLAQVQLGAGEVSLAGGRLGLEGEQVKTAANQQRLGAAGLRAETGLGIEQQRQQAEQSALQYRRMQADLTQMGVQIQTAASLDAANLRMQGMGQLADMIDRNPETVVSLYAGLAAIFGARIQEAGGSSSGTILAGPAQRFSDQFAQIGTLPFAQLPGMGGRSNPTRASNRFTVPAVGSGPFGSMSGQATVPPGLA
jgi:hypothetical protein